MKNKDIHEKSVHLVNAAIIDMCGDKGPPIAREVNTDSFIQTLNDSLMLLAPELCYGTGLALDPDDPLNKQTAEDIAAQEAERDKVMQQEMIQNVTEAVVEKIQGHLDRQEERLQKQVKKLGKEIQTKGASQHKFLNDNIASLEKYVDKMHEEQIQQFSTLKQLATEAATGKDIQKQISEEQNQNRGYSSPTSPRSKRAKASSVLDEEFHGRCAKDYLIICNEQLRQDMAINHLNSLVLGLIKINLQRETAKPADQGGQLEKPETPVLQDTLKEEPPRKITKRQILSRTSLYKPTYIQTNEDPEYSYDQESSGAHDASFGTKHLKSGNLGNLDFKKKSQTVITKYTEASRGASPKAKIKSLFSERPVIQIQPQAISQPDVNQQQDSPFININALNKSSQPSPLLMNDMNPLQSQISFESSNSIAAQLKNLKNVATQLQYSSIDPTMDLKNGLRGTRQGDSLRMKHQHRRVYTSLDQHGPTIKLDAKVVTQRADSTGKQESPDPCPCEKEIATRTINIGTRPMTQCTGTNRNYRLFNPTRSRSKRAEQLSMLQQQMRNKSRPNQSTQLSSAERKEHYTRVQTPTTNALSQVTRNLGRQHQTLMSIQPISTSMAFHLSNINDDTTRNQFTRTQKQASLNFSQQASGI